MAAVTSAIIGGLGVAKGIYDTIDGNKRRKQHQAELDAYQRQEIKNVYENMPISMIGTDIMREDASKNMATAMNSVSNAGTRAIIGATPQLVAQQNNVNRTIQQDLDDQVMKRNYAIANDGTRVQQMQEQREYNDLAGIGNAIDTARQDANMGLNTAINGAMYLGTQFGGNKTQTNEETGAVNFKNPNAKFSSTIGYTPKMSINSTQPTSYFNNNPIYQTPIGRNQQSLLNFNNV